MNTNHDPHRIQQEGGPSEISREDKSRQGEPPESPGCFSAKEKARFWTKVDIRAADECWPWLRAKSSWGYGLFPVYGEAKKKRLSAHRVAWQLSKGKIPSSMCVCHTCDNPPCCNPAHLWLGSQQDNTRDRHAKGRTLKGTTQPNAKLTEAQVIEIRLRHQLGCSLHQLEREYPVSRAQIRRIVQGKKWKCLKP